VSRPLRYSLLLSVLALAGCARRAEGPFPAAIPSSPAPSYAAPAPVAIESGAASYYADSLAGNATASGEPYDPRALTAAHRTLPFGTVVDVVREDGRAVRVRINDRGPFAKGRVIDLSRTAAEQLGMLRAGVVPVRLFVVARPNG
jgi:peptidoglycan lytic transglycosylase